MNFIKTIACGSSIAIVLLASCSTKKDWKCSCTVPVIPGITDGATTAGANFSTSFVIFQQVESEAKKSCDDGNKFNTLGISIALPCTLAER